MKRLFHPLFTVILALSLFAGITSAEKLTIWSTLTQPSRAQQLETIARDFESKNPGLEVEIVVMPWGGAMDRIVAAILAGNPPDLSIVGQGWPQTLAGTGRLVTLDDVVDELGGEDIFLGTSLSVLGRFQGKTYSIPVYVTPHVLMYRKSWLAEAGMSPPTTWEELYEVATAVTNFRTGRYGFAMPFDVHGGKPIWGFLLANGVTIFERDEAGNWQLNVNQPASVETFDFLAKLLRDAAPPAVTTYTTTEVSELIAKGVIMSRVDTPEVLEIVRQYSPQDLDDFGYVPLPARKRLGSSQGWVGMVVFDTPRQQYAKEFIKHMFAGSNLIDFALSYPYAMFPPVASAYSDPSYIEGLPHELKPIAEIAAEILAFSAGISMWNGDNPWAGEIENKLILPNALNRMLTEGISAEQAVQQVEREIRELMTNR